MTDPYPTNLTIEIDGNRLKSYLRAKWFLSWALVLCLMGMLCGLPSIGKSLDQGLLSMGQVLFHVARAAALGLGLGLAFALALYFTFSHGLARRFAEDLKVSVEGPFLRICQRLVVTTDRKLHFRAIVDYTVAQDPLMRLFGIHALVMTTTGGGQAATITVPGVKDCLQARDTLSEIDRLREHTS